VQNLNVNIIHLQENLERFILHGLSLEWDNALCLLDDAHRRKLKKPLFRLSDTRSRLGAWSGEKNEISLSRTFVLKYSWDDIREVLLHEMAHQYADRILRAGAERPHGPLFREACRKLRANPGASGTFDPLHDRIHRQPHNPRERHLMRIKKLMSLASSKNRHEAEAAMTKAHHLMKKYNIDQLADSTPRNFVSVFIGSPALRQHREDYHLANLLQTYYFVQGIWVSAYVLTKGKMGRVLEISGTIQNIEIATYVHAFVNQYIDSQWRIYCRGKHLNRYRKSDFAEGLIEGFRDKLESGKTAQTEKSDAVYALVKYKDPLLESYMNHRYPNTRSFTRRAGYQDDAVLKDGFAIGTQMVISKGITQEGTSDRPRLLTGQRG